MCLDVRQLVQDVRKLAVENDPENTGLLQAFNDAERDALTWSNTADDFRSKIMRLRKKYNDDGTDGLLIYDGTMGMGGLHPLHMDDDSGSDDARSSADSDSDGGLTHLFKNNIYPKHQIVHYVARGWVM